MSSNSAERFVAGLVEVLGRPERPLALHEPEFQGNEWSYVKECIETGWVSSVGRWVDEFEARLRNVTGAGHAVAIVNGTAALHLALHVTGVRSGDEVIVPALTFVATANAVSHCGAIPHFVDSDAQTLGMDPEALAAHLDRVGEKVEGGVRNAETGRRIAAIVPMHVFGQAARIDELVDVAARYGLHVVEDAAESLGTTYKGQHTGTFGGLGVLSFNGNKIVTTGGGGAIITSDEALARKAKHLSTTARLPHRWAYVHDEVAFNYRLPNMNAALGCAQLERLDDFVARKRTLAARYRETFSRIPGMEVLEEQPDCRSNYWLNAVRLSSPDTTVRDSMLDLAEASGFHCRPVWSLLNSLPMYGSCPASPLPVALQLEASLVNVPSSAALARDGQ